MTFFLLIIGLYINFFINFRVCFITIINYSFKEIDVRAGGGMVMTIGQMLRLWLTRLEWFDTLFPRIPVPIQKEIMDGLRDVYGKQVDSAAFFENFSG